MAWYNVLYQSKIGYTWLKFLMWFLNAWKEITVVFRIMHVIYMYKSIQIKSLLLSHHHSTSALVSEILKSVLQTVQKNKTTIYIWTVHIYRLYRRQCAKYTYIYSVHTVYYKDTVMQEMHTCIHIKNIYMYTHIDMLKNTYICTYTTSQKCVLKYADMGFNRDQKYSKNSILKYCYNFLVFYFDIF